MRKFYQSVDLRSRKAMTDFLEHHFRYPTMNSWNGSYSYACNLKIYKLGLDQEIADKLYEMLDIPEFFYFQSDLVNDFAQKHDYVWQARFNGRNGGYLVLYQGDREHYYPNRGTDDDADFEEWEMYELRERVKLVQEFDKLADDKYKNSMWYMQTVRRILQDRIYLGWMVSGKYASEFYITGQKGSKAVPPEEWIITKGTHEPIVTEELFNRVQEYFAKNKEEHALATKYDHKSKRESMFRGHLFCGECGKAMHIRRKVNHGRESYWYCCMIHEHYNSQYCSKKAVKSEQLESMVHTLIQNQMALYLDAKSIIAELNKKNTSQVRYKVYKEQINNLQRQIDRYMELKAALYEDYAEGTITAEDYVAMGQEYAQKADELRIFLSEIKKESRKYDPEYLGGEHWAKLVADFKDQKTLDRKMVEAFVNKLTLYNDGRAEIEFNFRDELEEVLLWAAMRKKEVNKYAG